MKANALDHVVVVVEDMDAARTQYARVFGEGAVAEVLDEPGYRRCIIRLGAQRLELCQPVDPEDGSRPQAARAFRGTLQRQGEGLHNLAIEIADVDAALGELRASGVPLIESSISHSFFVHPKALNGALVQFLEAEGPMRGVEVLHVHACPTCGWNQVPPGRCQRCRADVTPADVPPFGEVLASTVIERVPPDVLIEAPYGVVIVRLEDGLEVVALSSPEMKLVPGDRALLSVVQMSRNEQEAWAFQAATLKPSQGAGR